MKLSRTFYLQEDVVEIARNLLGKKLLTCFEGCITGGIITETEAYAGETDKASHAYGGKRTLRTEAMYQEGGIAYIYLCYGIHSLFNIVTNAIGIPHAVLIRGIRPITGQEIMLRRTGKSKIDNGFCNGPGKVSKALGIHYSHSGTDLLGNNIWLEENCPTPGHSKILAPPRIGIAYAAEDALLPYRFILNEHKY